MADHIQPDLCVVGAGALGIALAQHGKSLGARVTLVDRGPPEAGDGPQQKLRLAALQASAARAHAIRHGDMVGLSRTEPKISMKLVQERAKAVAEVQSSVTAHERLTALGIEVLRGAACFVDQNALMVGDIQIRPRSIVLALGGAVEPLPIPGLDQIDYFTPDSILDNARKLTHLLVIGGNAEAIGLAQAFARLGSEVTLVPQGPLLPAYDPEATAILFDALGAEGVRIMAGATIREILPRAQGTGVVVDLASGEETALDVSHVLLAGPVRADLSSLLPEKARLRAADGSVRQYERGALGQTSNRRVRLAGAAAGIIDWSHALAHGRAVVEQLVMGAPANTLAPQPHLVMTDPPLAQIGRIAGRARKARAGGSLLRASLAENQQARASGMAEGLVKVELSTQGHVLGAALVGPGAAEMAAVLALAQQRAIPLHALAGLSLPDPNLLSSVVSLGEQAAALQPVSPWAIRWRGAKRLVSFGQR